MEHIKDLSDMALALAAMKIARCIAARSRQSELSRYSTGLLMECGMRLQKGQERSIDEHAASMLDLWSQAFEGEDIHGRMTCVNLWKRDIERMHGAAFHLIDGALNGHELERTAAESIEHMRQRLLLVRERVAAMGAARAVKGLY